MRTSVPMRSPLVWDAADSARRGNRHSDPGRIYAVVLGGARDIANMRKLKAKEQFAILAELEPLQMMDYGVFPPRVARLIG